MRFAFLSNNVLPQSAVGAVLEPEGGQPFWQVHVLGDEGKPPPSTVLSRLSNGLATCA